MIDHPSGRSDQDVASLLVQSIGLGLHVGSSHDAHGLEDGTAEQNPSFFLYLNGELLLDKLVISAYA